MDWIDKLAESVCASMTKYKELKHFFWTKIPNYNGVRAFPRGLENYRLGALEARSICKVQMFINYALFPFHSFVAENDILFIEFYKYTQWPELTMSEIEAAHEAWKEWANHTIKHFEDISPSACMFQKMHSGAYFKQSVLLFGSGRFTSAARHKHSHAHFVSQVLKNHNGRFQLQALVKINSRIQSLSEVPDVTEKKRKRNLKRNTENNLLNGIPLFYHSIPEYASLVKKQLEEMGVDYDVQLYQHKTLQILNSPVVSHDKIVISPNWHSNGPRFDGGLVIQEDPGSNFHTYSFVSPKLFFSFTHNKAVHGFSVVQRTKTLKKPEDHPLKSWHIRLTGQYEVLPIADFAKSAYLIPDFTCSKPNTFFVNTFVDYF